MTDTERKWFWNNMGKLTEKEYKTFCKYSSDIAVAENELHKLYIAVKERVGSEVAE